MSTKKHGLSPIGNAPGEPKLKPEVFLMREAWEQWGWMAWTGLQVTHVWHRMVLSSSIAFPLATQGAQANNDNRGSPPLLSPALKTCYQSALSLLDHSGIIVFISAGIDWLLLFLGLWFLFTDCISFPRIFRKVPNLSSIFYAGCILGAQCHLWVMVFCVTQIQPDHRSALLVGPWPTASRKGLDQLSMTLGSLLTL